jgi:uncharacterized protein YjbJ (UPF0337 family)
MNQNHIKGTAEQVKGKLKEGLGDLTGNDRLKQEGQVDQIKGQAHKVVGNVKDAGSGLIDSTGSHKK